MKEPNTSVGKLTPEQLALEQEARAAREELYRRVKEEAKASGITFAEAASKMGVPIDVQQRLEGQTEIAKATAVKEVGYTWNDPKTKASHRVPMKEPAYPELANVPGVKDHLAKEAELKIRDEIFGGDESVLPKEEAQKIIRLALPLSAIDRLQAQTEIAEATASKKVGYNIWFAEIKAWFRTILPTVPFTSWTGLRSPATWLMRIMKSDWRTAVALIAVVVMLGLGVATIFLFRYDVRTTTVPGLVVRLDRLTGKVEWCQIGRGCGERIPERKP